MSRRPRLALAGGLALLLGACAAGPPAPPPEAGAVPPPPQAAPAPPAAPAAATRFAGLADRFTDRALKEERAGDLRGALSSWRVVSGLRPDAAEPRKRVADLAARLRKTAEEHYQAGLGRLTQGAPDAARREFLLALALDPAHEAALDALKNRVDPETVPYTVLAGDTFGGIAGKFYGDPSGAPVIAWMNDLDPAARPPAGRVLAIPVLPPPTPEKAPPERGTAQSPEPRPMEAAPETGPDRIQTEPVPATAPAVPASAAPPRPAPAEAAQEAERRKKELAEESYNEGVRCFINQQLAEAIRSWEQTLALNPGHPKAAKDIEKARALQKKLQDIK